jgi:hypothetical protein
MTRLICLWVLHWDNENQFLQRFCYWRMYVPRWRSLLCIYFIFPPNDVHQVVKVLVECCNPSANLLLPKFEPRCCEIPVKFRSCSSIKGSSPAWLESLTLNPQSTCRDPAWLESLILSPRSTCRGYQLTMSGSSVTPHEGSKQHSMSFHSTQFTLESTQKLGRSLSYSRGGLC